MNGKGFIFNYLPVNKHFTHFDLSHNYME